MFRQFSYFLPLSRLEQRDTEHTCITSLCLTRPFLLVNSMSSKTCMTFSSAIRLPGMMHTCVHCAQSVINDALGYMNDNCARREIPRTWITSKKDENFELC